MGHLFVPGNNSGIGFATMFNSFSIAGLNNNNWRSVTWSPTLGLYAAAGFGSVPFAGDGIMTSPDGVIWTVQAHPAIMAFRAITWSPELGLFCAVGIGTGAAVNRIATSPDGIVWTARASPGDAASADYQSVVWAKGLGLFVACSNNNLGFDIITSPDGINWTARITPGAIQLWTGLAWAEDKTTLVAVSAAGPIGVGGGLERVMTSFDGITWTLREVPIGVGTFAPIRVAYSQKLGIFVSCHGVADNTDDAFASSPDGISWTIRTVPFNTGTRNTFFAIVWSDEQQMFVAASQAQSPFKRFIASVDGINWFWQISGLNVVTDEIWSGIAFSPSLNLFVVVAQTGSTNFAATLTPAYTP